MVNAGADINFVDSTGVSIVCTALMNNDVRAVNDGLLATLPGLASMITRLGSVIIVLSVMEPIFTVIRETILHPVYSFVTTT